MFYCLWKVDLGNDEIGYLAEAISKQSVKGPVWQLLTAYSKMPEVRNDLKMELLGKKEAELNDLENSQCIGTVKK